MKMTITARAGTRRHECYREDSEPRRVNHTRLQEVDLTARMAWGIIMLSYASNIILLWLYGE